MELPDPDPGLREAMRERSALSTLDRSELKAYELISRALYEALEPGERVRAYADRELGGNQVDAMAYDRQNGVGRPDVMGYQSGGLREDTDVFARYRDAGPSAPDVMGYQPGGPQDETDALAYNRPPETPENNAFRGPDEARARDVDFLVLTDARLMRGFLEAEKVMITEAREADPEVRVTAGTYVAVRLPPALRGINESDWWCWRAPEGVDARIVAQTWNRPERPLQTGP